MSTFDDAEHPRGQAGNAGQFRAKANSVPAEALEEPNGIDGKRTGLRILTGRLGDFEAAVEKANRRLARAGAQEKFTFTSEEKVWFDDNNRAWLVCDVTLNAPVLAVGKWHFVGAHQKTESGAVVSHFFGGEKRFAVDSAMRCEHCGQFRARQQVYTVRDEETGELKQIGKSCLQLFLGVRPEGLWALTDEVGAELSIDEDDEFHLGDGLYRTNVWDGEQLLLATIRQMNNDGGEYISRARSSFDHPATISRVKEGFDGLVSAPSSDAEKQEISDILAWVSSSEPGEEDDYAANLKAVLTRHPEYGEIFVGKKHAGIAASAVAAYRRHLSQSMEKAEREKRQAQKTPAFRFKPGESLKGKDLELTVLSARRGQDYGYGAPLHLSMIDDEGHVFYWKASGTVGGWQDVGEDGNGGFYWMPEAGARVSVVGGSVKEHRISDFNGDHETVIWRVKVAPTQGSTETPAV